MKWKTFDSYDKLFAYYKTMKISILLFPMMKDSLFNKITESRKIEKQNCPQNM